MHDEKIVYAAWLARIGFSRMERKKNEKKKEEEASDLLRW